MTEELIDLGETLRARGRELERAAARMLSAGKRALAENRSPIRSHQGGCSRWAIAMSDGPDPAFAASPSSPFGSVPSGLQSGVKGELSDEVRCARKCWSIGEPACWELGIKDWVCADCKAGAEND